MERNLYDMIIDNRTQRNNKWSYDVLGCAYGNNHRLTMQYILSTLQEDKTKPAFNKENMTKQWGHLLKYCEDKDYHAYQTLAFLAMNLGVEFDEDSRQLMIEACKKDEWATESNERAKEMNRMIEALESYEGTPTNFTTINFSEKAYSTQGVKYKDPGRLPWTREP